MLAAAQFVLYRFGIDLDIHQFARNWIVFVLLEVLAMNDITQNALVFDQWNRMQ